MSVYVLCILCLVALLGVCQATDYRQFLRGLQREIRHELTVEEFTKRAELTEDLYVNKSCSCGDSSCSCCAKLLSMNVCVNASFEKDVAVDITITVNGRPIITTKIKGPNPPPMCKKIFGRKVCISFDNVSLDLKARTFSACVNIQIAGKEFKLGCFKLPPRQQYRSNQNEITGL